jgi:glycosyltransferase AglD
MKSIYRQIARIGPGFVIIIAFIFLSFHSFDGKHLWTSVIEFIQHPVILLTIVTVYLFSFCLKAVAWKLYIKEKVRFSTCLLGILYSLLVNHISPIKLGDLVRIKILSTRDANVPFDAAFHSVLILRLLDMFCLLLIALAGLWGLNASFRIPVWSLSLCIVLFIIIGLLVHKYFPLFLSRQFILLKHAFTGTNGVTIVLLTFISWLLEASILYGTVTALNRNVSFFEAVFANSLTVAGQVFQITPGGIANYESFLVFGLHLAGVAINEGYTIAVLTHAIKFGFSYAAGAVAFIIYPISLMTMKQWIKVRGVKEK